MRLYYSIHLHFIYLSSNLCILRVTAGTVHFNSLFNDISDQDSFRFISQSWILILLNPWNWIGWSSVDHSEHLGVDLSSEDTLFDCKEEIICEY